MIYEKEGYSYNDLTIVPSESFSSIASRSECCPFYHDNMLPLFTSPMSCVVDENNFNIWEYNGIHAILPRTVKYQKRIEYLIKEKWVALSLNEFKKLFCSSIHAIKKETIVSGSKFKVCIDIANGHMKQIYDAISEAKALAEENNYKLVIMAGNIANPELYWIITTRRIPVDYIRLSIGTGSGCLTSSNTGVYYPIASLIDECKNYKNLGRIEGYDPPKIVADGGIRNYKDINIALALGADYVMVGSLFASIIESSAELYKYNSIDNSYFKYNEINNTNEIKEMHDAIDMVDHDLVKYINHDLKSKISINDGLLRKRFYGMSTKEAQLEINNALEYPLDIDTKTSEGVAKMLECKYTLRQWVENFIDYLRSAMSYTNARTLDEFKNKSKLIVNTSKAIDSVNK